MMLNKIIDFSLQYKLLVILLFMVLSFLGYRSYHTVPIDAFPDITPKQVVIYTESVGNSAEDIEKLITYPLESALSGMAGVKNIVSNSFFGLSYVSIFFEEEYDIYFLRQQVTERVLSVDIPEGWGKPTLGPNTTGLGQVFWYEVKDATQSKSIQELRELQDFLGADKDIEKRLKDRPRSGRPATITAEQWCKIMALACEKPENHGVPITHWSQSSLTAEIIKQGILESVSPNHIGNFLKKSNYNLTEASIG